MQLDPQVEGPGGDNKNLLTFIGQLVHPLVLDWEHVRQELSQELHIFGFVEGYFPVGHVISQLDGPGEFCKYLPDPQLSQKLFPDVEQVAQLLSQVKHCHVEVSG